MNMIGDHGRPRTQTARHPPGPNCAHDRRWETAGPKRATRTQTARHPPGPNCAHDRRPWEIPGPKRVTRTQPQLPSTMGDRGPEARDTHLAKRVTPFLLRRGPPNGSCLGKNQSSGRGRDSLIEGGFQLSSGFINMRLTCVLRKHQKTRACIPTVT